MIELFLVALYAALPVLEMRLSIPLGLEYFDLPLVQVLVTSILSNVGVTYGVYLLLPFFVDWFQRHWPWFDRLMSKIFTKTRKKFSHRIHVWGAIFLFFLVAVPLPGSGGWTGALLAYLFKLDKKTTAICLGLGGIVSAGIITLVTLGVGSVL
jgi:uncharacterized membrane protein